MTSGEERRAKVRGKNIIMAVLLVAFVILFYLVTMVRMGTA